MDGRTRSEKLPTGLPVRAIACMTEACQQLLAEAAGPAGLDAADRHAALRVWQVRDEAIGGLSVRGWQPSHVLLLKQWSDKGRPS